MHFQDDRQCLSLPGYFVPPRSYSAPGDPPSNKYGGDLSVDLSDDCDFDVGHYSEGQFASLVLSSDCHITIVCLRI